MFIWEVGWDVCRDETFFIPGLHENVSTWDDFTRDNLHNIVSANQASIISSRQSGTECLHDKNCPALAGIPVERTGIPLYRDATKNVPANISILRQRDEYDRYYCMARSHLTSRPGKRPVSPPI